jgi:hypothetical protein
VLTLLVPFTTDEVVFELERGGGALVADLFEPLASTTVSMFSTSSEQPTNSKKGRRISFGSIGGTDEFRSQLPKTDEARRRPRYYTWATLAKIQILLPKKKEIQSTWRSGLLSTCHQSPDE